MTGNFGHIKSITTRTKAHALVVTVMHTINHNHNMQQCEAHSSPQKNLRHPWLSDLSEAKIHSHLLINELQQLHYNNGGQLIPTLKQNTVPILQS